MFIKIFYKEDDGWATPPTIQKGVTGYKLHGSDLHVVNSRGTQNIFQDVDRVEEITFDVGQ